jgi:hypothetical protein
VSGETPPILLSAERGDVLTRAVVALGRFPRDEAWVLIGGIAVFLRLGSITRPTADADTVARSQSELIQRLIDDEISSVVAGGSLQVPGNDGDIDIDVMDLADEPLPADPEREAFARSRRAALASAHAERIIVSDQTSTVVADALVPIATVGALTALKVVSMVRRPHSNHPQKVGSDIHDLVRLVASGGAQSVANELVALDPKLATWVAAQVERSFGADLRYTLVRLRNNDRSPGALALADDAIGATVILGAAIDERLGAEQP